MTTNANPINPNISDILKIPCTIFRGGTSKGPCFLKSDLPSDEKLRNECLLKLMGSPDHRQIDGIGGGNSLYSKAVIINPSKREDADIDYLLCQVHLDQPIVETTLNCGNMLSAVAPFAIEKHLIKPTHPETHVRIYNENTKKIIIATLQTPNGYLTYKGETYIDGVPNSSAPIKLSFLNPVGSKTRTLLPTGNIRDEIEGISISCVDVAVPMVITTAEALGKTGYESKQALDSDKEFLKLLENLRQKAALKMQLGDVSQSISPKICMLSAPCKGGMLTSRYFTPFDCHDAHAVSGALCLAAACLIEDSVAYNIANLNLPNTTQYEKEIIIEHPSGKLWTSIHVEKQFNTNTNMTNINFPRASFIRTARPLFSGHVLIVKP